MDLDDAAIQSRFALKQAQTQYPSSMAVIGGIKTKLYDCVFNYRNAHHGQAVLAVEFFYPPNRNSLKWLTDHGFDSVQRWKRKEAGGLFCFERSGSRSTNDQIHEEMVKAFAKLVPGFMLLNGTTYRASLSKYKTRSSYLAGWAGDPEVGSNAGAEFTVYEHTFDKNAKRHCLSFADTLTGPLKANLEASGFTREDGRVGFAETWTISKSPSADFICKGVEQEIAKAFPDSVRFGNMERFSQAAREGR